MIRCCECGINILLVGQVHFNGGYISCPECKTELYAIPANGRSYPASWVYIDHTLKIINIRKPVESA